MNKEVVDLTTTLSGTAQQYTLLGMKKKTVREKLFPF